jgi:hypothetical protein
MLDEVMLELGALKASHSLVAVQETPSLPEPAPEATLPPAGSWRRELWAFCAIVLFGVIGLWGLFWGRW